MSSIKKEQLIKCQKKINYFFKDLTLLAISLTHSSCINKLYNYERLEFLGDAIINSVISELLFLKFPHYNEGDLTKHKNLIVNKNNLGYISNEFKLINYSALGKSINLSNKSTINNISADLYESLVGAIFLDSDYDTVKSFINITLLEQNHFLSKINNKGNLIEFCSKKRIKSPIYHILNESLSSNDNKIFNIKLDVADKYFFGSGSKIKEAEEVAARKALDFFCI